MVENKGNPSRGASLNPRPIKDEGPFVKDATTLLQSLRQKEHTEKALTRLGTTGMKLDDLSQLLIQSVTASTKRISWAEGSGASAAKLKVFPKRVEKLANEIENANKNRFIDPELHARMEGDVGLLRLNAPDYRKLKELPLMLRDYADFMREDVLPIVASFGRQSERDQAIDRLLTEVYSQTKFYFVDHLANLLTETAYLLAVLSILSIRALWPKSMRQRATPLPLCHEETEGLSFVTIDESAPIGELPLPDGAARQSAVRVPEFGPTLGEQHKIRERRAEMLSQIDVMIVRVTPEMIHNWGWFLALGVLLLVLGIAAIVRSVSSTVVSVMFFGWILVFAGVIEFVNAFMVGKWAGFFLHLLAAILFTVTGLLMVARPVISAEAATFLMSMFFLIGGL